MSRIRDRGAGRSISVSISTLGACLIIAIAVLVAYANSFNASWQFDDLPNIVNNQPLHIDNLMPGTLWQTFFAKPGHVKFYRPVACLSFALNWYFGGADNTTGYHIVNVSIHILTAILLFLTMKVLFETASNHQKLKEEAIISISLLATLLWALNPIQTMAVTYIVQRMAMLAAFFYLAGVLAYIHMRHAVGKVKKVAWALSCGVFYLLAMGSKENAAMFPMGLLLIEAAFFRNLSDPRTRRHLIIIGGALMLGIAVAGSIVFLNGNLLATLNESGSRFYTPLQRLITQPRILLFYLKQLVYPLPSTLSVAHGIDFSSSLFTPASTFPAILVVAAMIFGAIFFFHKHTLLCFSLLFFFVNHAIESSVLNLELAFEHRNYLPSLFLFMAPAAGIHRLVKKYQATNRTIRALVAVTISVVIASFGYWTHQRNLAWQTSQSLWRDAMIKAPDQVRPISHVAIDFAWSGNPTPRDYRIALRLFEKSLALQMARKDMRADILGNIGNIYFQMGEMDRALVYQQKALAEGTKNKKLRYDFIKTLVVQSRWEDAERHAKVLTGEGRINEEYYNIHGFILLWQNRPSEALDQFRKALRLAPFKPNIMLNTGKALSLAGSFENAEWFYRLVHKLEPKDPMPYFGMIENSLRWGGQQAANRYAVRLFSVFPVDFIQDQLTVLSNNPRTIPFSSQSIAAPIAHCMKDICRKNSNASF